ncbi:MAG: glycosyl transferase, WecB/TagA/CpsF family [Mucilaginibacter sp.]|nr:glycosyl transferase, WecB/TagA/CpsF family [Mucilaginibacter sp.]
MHAEEFNVERTKDNVVNVYFDNLSFNEALLKFRSSRFIVTPNIDHLYNLYHNEAFFAAYNKADLVLCDSKILSLLSPLVCGQKIPQIAGSDFFPALCSHYQNDQSFKIFLLGGTTDESVDLATKNLNNKYNSIVGGYFSPPFGFEKDPKMIKKIIEMVNASGCSVLAVGLGSPKQELFIANNIGKFHSVKQIVAIGATIDFQSGYVQRAPKWISKVGLEWFYRFINEPKRLFKRYFVNGLSLVANLFFLKRISIKIKP